MTLNSCPLVSVLIPAYNHERYIQDAIQSIIAQSYKNIEILILNDGSSDSTWGKILAMRPECEKRFIRADFGSQTNKGRCETFDTLLARSEGEYVFFIASDDIALPHAVETLAHFLSQNPDYVLAVGDNCFVNSNNQRIFWDKDHNAVFDGEAATYKSFASALQAGRPDVDFLSEEFGSYATLLKDNYIPNGYLIRRNALIAAGGFTNEAPLEDYYQNLQLAKIGKFKFFDEILFCYRWHETNSVKTENIRFLANKTLIYERKLVDESNNLALKQIFYNYFHRRQYVFRTPMLSLYFIRNRLERRVFLECFGRSFQIYYKQRFNFSDC